MIDECEYSRDIRVFERNVFLRPEKEVVTKKPRDPYQKEVNLINKTQSEVYMFIAYY